MFWVLKNQQRLLTWVYDMVSLSFKKTAADITEEGFRWRKAELFGKWKESAGLDTVLWLPALNGHCGAND